MNTTKALTAGIFGLGLFLAACNSTDGGGGGAAISEADVVGTWTINSMHQKGPRKTTPPGGATVTTNVDTMAALLPGSSIEFKADKSMVMTMGLPIAGTWKLEGTNKISTVVTFFGMSDTSVMTATISGNQGTFVSRETTTDEEDDGTVIEEDFETTVKATKQ